MKKLKKDIAYLLRFSITGTDSGPGLYELCEIIGKEKVLARIDKIIVKLTEYNKNIKEN